MVILQLNQVFIKESGVAGVRIEDDILVTNEGYEVLTHYEK